jgi:hypothetical protein
MIRFFLSLMLSLSLLPQSLFSQILPEFGKISKADLENNIYKPDPGADAIILSDIGVVTLNYSNGFYVEFERDVRIKIVNSKGYDYSDIEIPYSISDKLSNYKASSFNLRDGEKVETPVIRKSFIREQSTKYRNTLKFNFPDVHEGTVIEYTYKIRKQDESIGYLVPWFFQSSIPIVKTSLTVGYPDFFNYKTIVSGNPDLVTSRSATQKSNFNGVLSNIRIVNWSAANVPSFHKEPLIKSISDNLTRITFELASVNFPNSSIEEITPTYATLTKKLLEREDFGKALKMTGFLKGVASDVTSGLTDDLLKLKSIHKYISEKFLWDGEEDYTSSSGLKKVFNNEKGNSADINMILIAMLRNVNIKADPVILSTRSNGSINPYSAMLQQFNYLVANVTINDKSFLVDATNPLRPFDMLPFDCLNGSGRLINNESKFLDLRNSEKSASYFALELSLKGDGLIEGEFRNISSGYNALSMREIIKLEGEEGYAEMLEEEFSEGEISEYIINNISEPDSDIVETGKIKINEGSYLTGDKLIFNPYFEFTDRDNDFISPERRYPVDFGCPVEDEFTLSMTIPDKYVVEELPPDINLSLGKADGSYKFSCSELNNKILVKSSMKLSKITFTPSEYNNLRDFYAKMLQSQNRLVVLKKKI